MLVVDNTLWIRDKCKKKMVHTGLNLVCMHAFVQKFLQHYNYKKVVSYDFNIQFPSFSFNKLFVHEEDGELVKLLHYVSLRVYIMLLKLVCIINEYNISLSQDNHNRFIKYVTYFKTKCRNTFITNIDKTLT